MYEKCVICAKTLSYKVNSKYWKKQKYHLCTKCSFVNSSTEIIEGHTNTYKTFQAWGEIPDLETLSFRLTRTEKDC